MALFEKFREGWVRPALFFGNNPISLAGGAITTAAGITMIGYWLVEIFGRPNDNPYLGIIFFLLLPALFIGGLILIPVGLFLRRRKLRQAEMCIRDSGILILLIPPVLILAGLLLLAWRKNSNPPAPNANP